MARRRLQTSPLARAISLLVYPLVTSYSAVTLRLPDIDIPGASSPPPPRASRPAGPSLDAVRPRLEVRSASIQSCARQCIANAVTKSTGCKQGDYSCECETANANAIAAGAFACVEAACGAIVAEVVFSSASAPCQSVLDGQYTPSGVTQTSFTPDATSSASSGSSGSSGSSDSSPSNSSSSLSTGVIVGIAIGAAAGGAIACAIIYWFCLRKTKRSEAPHGDSSTVAPAGPPKPNFDGKPATFTTSTHTPTAPGVSPYPGIMPSPSPVSQASPLVYAGMTGLPNGALQQHQQHQHQHPQQQPQNLIPGAYQPIPQQRGGYAPPHGQQQAGYPPPYGQRQGYHEVHGQGVQPEMYAEAQTRQELHGQTYRSGVYEMPSERRS
ncbi:Uncharacterized protein TCAP_03145 [Tolypocladium capitatum]|uniref:CFEM domain-containing protein n=1 Tax=Tolypocladium capitatum TaxID=45235 RepID=A0A2K3QHA6_9HYPO|nr:Uncharacterized protein TCAP_03145 [Tolypocladium capitatum]